MQNGKLQKVVFGFPGLRGPYISPLSLWERRLFKVPSPLWGEGQGEG